MTPETEEGRLLAAALAVTSGLYAGVWPACTGANGCDCGRPACVWIESVDGTTRLESRAEVDALVRYLERASTKLWGRRPWGDRICAALRRLRGGL